MCHCVHPRPVGICCLATKSQHCQEQGIPPRAGWLWVNICFGMRGLKLGRSDPRRPAAIYSPVRPEKSFHEFVSVDGVFDLTMLIIDGWF